MIMNKRHIIESATFETCYPTEEFAFEYQEVFGDFVKTELLPLVDEIFDEMSDIDIVVRIDTLELDLGSVNAADFRGDLKNRLREQLVVRLQQEISASNLAAGNSMKISRKHSDFELLCIYLTTGTMPWYASLGENRTLELLLDQVLGTSGSRLIEFVSRSEHRSAVVTRMVKQFSDQGLGRFTGLLFALNEGRFLGILQELFRLGESLLASDYGNVRLLIWKLLIHAGLENNRHLSSVQQLFQQLLLDLSVRHSEQYADFLYRLLLLSSQQNRSLRLQQILLGLYRASSNESPQAGTQDVLPLMASYENDEQQIAHDSLIAALTTGSLTEIRLIWQRLLKQSPQLITTVLTSYGQRAAVRRTIARRFPEPMIRDIIILLEPTNSVFIEQVVSQPHIVRYASEQAKTDEPTTRSSLWELTLTYLLVERGSRFNRKSFLGSLMTQMAANQNVEVAQLYLSILLVLKPDAGHGSGSLQGELFQLLTELQVEGGNTPEQTRKDDSINEDSVSGEALGSRLIYALTRGRVADLDIIWQPLLTHHAHLLKQILFQYGQQVLVRRTIAKDFSESMLLDIIVLLEPTQSAFIWEVMSRVELLQREAVVPVASVGKATLVLREFTLSYLLVERGSQFNKKSYLASLIKQMAAHENMLARDILLSIVAMLNRVPEQFALKHELLQLLSDLGSIFGVDPDVVSVADSRHLAANPQHLANSAVYPGANANRADRQSIEAIRAYELYDNLVRSLLAGRPVLAASGEQIKLEVLISELIKYHPVLLQRIFQELLSGTLPLRTLLKLLSAESISQLLLAYLSTHPDSSYEGRTNFMKTMETFAGRSKFTNLYYFHIFSRLLAEEQIDFEALAGLDASADGRVVLDDIVSDEIGPDEIVADDAKNITTKTQSEPEPEVNAASSTLKPPQMPQGAYALEFLTSYLNGKLPLDVALSAALLAAMETLLDERPEALRNLLLGLMADAAVVKRLIDMMPERLLVQILFLLRAYDHSRLLLCADLMTNALYQASRLSNLPAMQLQGLKWQFIFNYLFVDGRHFTDTRFVQLFAAFMVSSANINDAATFYTLLRQRLDSSARVRARGMVEHIGMVLTELAQLASQSSAVSATFAQTSADAEVAAMAIQRERLQAATLTAAEIVRLKAEAAAADKAKADLKATAIAREKARSRSEQSDTGKEDIREDIYIYNAGLVMLAPYLPRLFGMVGLLEGTRFIDSDAAERGAHLLQFMVNESTSSPEYLLVLNKLLCGIRPGVPLIREVVLSANEISAAEGLLQGVISNWGAVKNTSISGLRESFLQREAHLQLKDDAWQVLVEARGYDVLMDQIPWSFATIKLPWMQRIIHVHWRQS